MTNAQSHTIACQLKLVHRADRVLCDGHSVYRAFCNSRGDSGPRNTIFYPFVVSEHTSKPRVPALSLVKQPPSDRQVRKTRKHREAIRRHLKLRCTPPGNWQPAYAPLASGAARSNAAWAWRQSRRMRLRNVHVRVHAF